MAGKLPPFDQFKEDIDNLKEKFPEFKNALAPIDAFISNREKEQDKLLEKFSQVQDEDWDSFSE